jgi:hypothetical protein
MAGHADAAHPGHDAIRDLILAIGALESGSERDGLCIILMCWLELVWKPDHSGFDAAWHWRRWRLPGDPYSTWWPPPDGRTPRGFSPRSLRRKGLRLRRGRPPKPLEELSVSQRNRRLRGASAAGNDA